MPVELLFFADDWDAHGASAGRRKGDHFGIPLHLSACFPTSGQSRGDGPCQMDRPLHGLRSIQAGALSETCAVDARRLGFFRVGKVRRYVCKEL